MTSPTGSAPTPLNPPVPPAATARPVSSVLHGVTRIDEFAWLREKDNPEVIAHLEAENAYCAAMLSPTEGLQETLFQEIKARIQETDMSLPTRKGPWSYLTKTIEGIQYSIHLRRPRDQEADESADQVLLDENQLAEGHDFFSLGTFEPSHDHNLLAWATDTDGSEMFELRITDLRSNTVLDDVLEETAPGVVWAADNQSLLYLTLDDLMRPHKVWRHVLGTEQAADELIHEEPDERFYLSMSLSSTDEYVILSAGSHVTSDVHVMPTAAANTPGASSALRLVEPRSEGIEYSLDHHRALDGTESFFIIGNHEVEGFRLYRTGVDTLSRSNWSNVGLHEPSTPDDSAAQHADGTADEYPVKLDGFDLFQRAMVLHERADALERFRVVELTDNGSLHQVTTLWMPEPVHTIWPGGNPEFLTTSYRFGYTSPITPPTVFEQDLFGENWEDRRMLKQQPVLGGFTSDSYVCERVWAPAADGVQIPVSVVRHKDTELDGTAPLCLYGYGSYEISIDPTFSTMRLSLLDRGMVFAIAHIRGGGERGRKWYNDGKFLKKHNTFTDFISVADHLANTKVCDGSKIVARGGSAGGLLMGAVTNLAPQRWAAIVAEVPFVDVVTTMLDDTLPLTQIEWDEWGNPNDPEFGAYMSSYSPYDNIGAKDYPTIFITAGLNDPRVGFWEPAKWAQRLRQRSTSGKPVLLKTELGAGHQGPTGRYAVWHDEAQTLAFILTSVGITD
jgi:oligopeptidase B